MVIQGDWDKHTTLIGGIHSESVDFSVSSIDFVGNGKDNENWQVPEESPNAGAPNKAFYGDSQANADRLYIHRLLRCHRVRKGSAHVRAEQHL